MSVTVRGTDILFNDGSTQSTAASGAGAKAWVNFNGTNGTIRASYNVSSVMRNGTGNYTINFTNAMPDTNYAASLTGQYNGSASVWAMEGNTARTTSAMQVMMSNSAGFVDAPIASVSVFR